MVFFFLVSLLLVFTWQKSGWNFVRAVDYRTLVYFWNLSMVLLLTWQFGLCLLGEVKLLHLVVMAQIVEVSKRCCSCCLWNSYSNSHYFWIIVGGKKRLTFLILLLSNCRWKVFALNLGERLASRVLLSFVRGV